MPLFSSGRIQAGTGDVMLSMPPAASTTAPAAAETPNTAQQTAFVSVTSLAAGSFPILVVGVDGVEVVSLANGTLTLGLTATNTQGTYSYPSLVIDQQGRIVGVSSDSVVSSLTALGDSSIAVTGSPLKSAGTLYFSLLNTAVTAGTYSLASVVVDAQGRIQAAMNTVIETVVNVGMSGNDGITVMNSPITSSGTFVVGMAPSGVSPGSYSLPIITIDAQGRITKAASGVIEQTDIFVTGDNAIGVAGSPVNQTGTLTFNLESTSVVAGSYTLFAVDSQGRLTHARDLAITDLGVTSVSASGDNAISVFGSPVTTTGTITFALAATTVVSGTYTYSSITVDAQGRITKAASGVIAQTSISAVGDNAIGVSGSPVNQTGTPTFNLESTSVIAGSYTLFAVDSQGRLTYARNLAVTDLGVTSVAASGDNAISVSGSPVTTTGTLSFALAVTGVSAGTYSYPSITVDAQGRITLAHSNPGGNVTSVNAVGANGISVSGGPVTTSGTFVVTLGNTSVIAGTYINYAVDTTGRLTLARSLSATDIDNILGYTPANAAGV